MELQPVVVVVRGVEHGRRGVSADGVQLKPEPVAGERSGTGVLRGGAGAGSAAGSGVGRALQRGRGTTESVGEPEELSEEGRRWRCNLGRWSRQPDGRLPRGEAEKLDAAVVHRHGGAASEEGKSQAVLC